MTPAQRRRQRKQTERYNELVVDQIKLCNRVLELERFISRSNLSSRKDSVLGGNTK